MTASLLALAALGLTFLVLHFSLAQSSRFVPDDLCLFGSVRRLGVLGTERVLYATWSGRWASNLIVAAALSLMTDARSAFPYALVLLGFVVAAAWLAIRTICAGRVARGAMPLVALASVALLFFSTPERGDSWFFVFCSIENLVPLCCALLALACVLRAEERMWLVVPGALLGAVATAGHESVALPVLALGSGALLGELLRRRTFDARRARAAAIVLVVAWASFGVSAASPGSAARLRKLVPSPWSEALWSAATRGPEVLLEVARAGLAPLAATLAVWAVAGSLLAPVDARPRSPRRLAALLVALLAASWVVAAAATLPGFYALEEPPPLRAQLVLAFFLVCATAWLGLELGAVLRPRPRAGAMLAAALVGLVGLVLAREVPRMRADAATARVYARAYDARMDELREARRTKGRGPILLAPLPPSGVLRSAEISADNPMAHENRCLRRMTQTLRPVLRRSEPQSAP